MDIHVEVEKVAEVAVVKETIEEVKNFKKSKKRIF